MIERLYLISSILIIISSCNTANSKYQSSPNVVSNEVKDLDDDIWAIHQDQTGTYWFGSNTEGIYCYDGNTLRQYTEDDGLVDNSIRGIQEDKDGTLYIETPDGISKYDGTRFETLRFTTSEENVWRLSPDDLWFNCNGNTLIRYDGHSLHQLQLPVLNLDSIYGTEVVGLGFAGMNHSPYAVYGVDRDQDGAVWIGTIVAGAFRYDGHSFLHIGEQELTTLPDGRVPGVRSILQDNNGYVWLSNFVSKYEVTTIDSIQYYNKLPGIDPIEQYFPDRLPYYNAGLTDTDGNLWMTTYTGGVWKYDGNQLTNYPVASRTNAALLLTIYQDNSEVIWVGSRNTGVFRFDGKEFQHFDKFDKKERYEFRPDGM